MSVVLLAVSHWKSWVISQRVLFLPVLLVRFARSADMWGVGCLIWEVYNGVLPQATALKTVAKVSFFFFFLSLLCN